MTYRFGLSRSAVVVIYVVQIGEIEAIMGSEGSISSVSRLDGRQVSLQLPGEKGGEIALPKCVHFHVSRSTGGYRQ